MKNPIRAIGIIVLWGFLYISLSGWFFIFPIPFANDAKTIREMEQKGDWPAMLELSEKRLETNETSGEWWFIKGYALAKLKRQEDAIAAYEKATRHKEKFAEAWHNKGWLELNLKKYAEAEASFREAIHIRPDVSRYRYGLGAAFFNMGRYDDVKNIHTDLEKTDPIIAGSFAQNFVSKIPPPLTQQPAEPPPEPVTIAPEPNIKDRLLQLEALRRDKVISEKEYREKRKQLLDAL